jgi:hypothetical protein
MLLDCVSVAGDWPPLSNPQMILEWLWSSGGMKLTGKNRRAERKTRPSATLSITYPTRTVVGAGQVPPRYGTPPNQSLKFTTGCMHGLHVQVCYQQLDSWLQVCFMNRHVLSVLGDVSAEISAPWILHIEFRCEPQAVQSSLYCVRLSKLYFNIVLPSTTRSCSIKLLLPFHSLHMLITCSADCNPTIQSVPSKTGPTHLLSTNLHIREELYIWYKLKFGKWHSFKT